MDKIKDNTRQAYRGRIFSFIDQDNYIDIEDGLMFVESGKISQLGSYQALQSALGDITLIDYQTKLICPGFIDTHIHANQISALACYGENLLSWLDKYVYPAEQKFKNALHAEHESHLFIDELLRNGTTTACAYGSVMPQATDILFSALSERKLRFIVGNALMDSAAPKGLCLSAQENYDASIQLIETWHGKDRLHYAITPRYALSCSPELLNLTQALAKKYPDCYIQTHLSENHQEIAAVKSAYPKHHDYLGVYEHHGLLRDNTILAHCLHLSTSESVRIAESGAIMAWCPVSNRFLGSGCFDYVQQAKLEAKIALGSDVGAGTSFSLFRVIDECYKETMARGGALSSLRGWYMASLGAAKALGLEHYIGSLEVGKEADFIVIDPSASALSDYRLQQLESIEELLFCLQCLGDDRHIYASYIHGERAQLRS